MSELHDRGGWPKKSEKEKRRKKAIRDKMKRSGYDKERKKAEDK